MSGRILVGGLDIETTGLDKKDHRIIEIAISIRDLVTGERVGAFEQRFNPRRSIDPKAEAVHKISLGDLVGCPLWGDHAARIQKLLSKCSVLVGHNGIEFDFPFIQEELRRSGLEMPDAYQFDTMQEGRWACEDGKIPRLGELAFACGFEYDTEKAHSALYDTELMMDCFFHARKHYGLFALPDEFESMAAMTKAA